MTQTTPAKTRARRKGAVYGIDCLDVDHNGHPTGQIRRCDYVGKTRQKVRARNNQHRDDQPWSDLIVGEAYVLAQGMWTEPELDAVEAHLIGQWRPRYNYLLNEGNPERIEKWRAREQRWARDDAAGRPRWVPGDERSQVVAPTTGGVTARWQRWHVVLGAWVAAWTLLTVLAWGWFDRFDVMGEHGPRWHGAAAATLALGLLVWAARTGRGRRKRRRR